MGKSLLTTFYLIVSAFFINTANAQDWKVLADSARYFMDEEEDFPKAIRYFSNSIDLLKKDSLGTLSYAKVLNGIGSAYYYNGSFKKAEQSYLEAREIRAKKLTTEHPSYLAINNNLATLYGSMGYYDKAETLHIETKNAREKVLGKDDISYAESCNNLGSFYFEIGKADKALEMFLETKRILGKELSKDHPNYISTLSNIATVYNDMGRYAEAEESFLEAKSIEEKAKGNHTTSYASIANNLAILYVHIGQYKKAEALYLEAKKIREKLLSKEHPEYAEICANLASLYDIMERNKDAEPLYLEAKNLSEKIFGKEHPAYTQASNNLGVFYLKNKDLKKAEPLLTEGKNIIENLFGKDNLEYATACNNLAILYDDNGEVEKAEAMYKEVRELREKHLGKKHQLYSQTIVALANFYWNQKKTKQANDLFNEAFQINSGQLKEIFEFTNESEKMQFIDNVAGSGHAFHSFYYSNQNAIKENGSYNVSLFNRGLVLSSTTKLKAAVYKSGNTDILKKYDKWSAVKNELAFWYAKPKDEQPANLKTIEENANNLEKELIKTSTAFKSIQNNGAIDFKNIQARLAKDEAAIEFVEFDYYDGKRWTDSTFYIALILKKDNPQPQTVHLFEKKELEELLTIFTNAKANHINEFYSANHSNANSQNVYDLIWKPLEKQLAGITKVYYAPAGLLHRVSFAALPINNMEVLSDKIGLSQLNTTASVLENRTQTLLPTDKLTLFGGIEYDVDSSALKNTVAKYTADKSMSRSMPLDVTRGGIWQKLEGTQLEVEGIKRSSAKFIVNTFSGIQATEESIKSLNGSASPAVLHIATHGFFFPDPKETKKDPFKAFETSGKVFKNSSNPLLRSGLLFAGANNTWQGKTTGGIEDGILTSYEVSNMYLPNTKLVVLSACETALGDIKGSEGVYGLQRAFKMAGVENLVMSLWKVPDTETSEFMMEFYKNLFNKQTIEDAFNGAQKAMKNKYRSDPYKWAAWVLVR